MRIHILTLFPEMFQGPFDASILKRARERGLVDISIHNIRDYTSDRHRTVDDYAYGGGAGMVMKAEPLFRAVEAREVSAGVPVVLLSPQGRLFTQREAERLSRIQEMVLLCGHYEGLDERVREHLVTEELSIGDYVLTGGELPAMVVVDAIVRLLPGVLGHGIEATADDSHTSGLLQYPQYTRPSDFRGWEVPEVLLSGNHAAVAQWRRQQALKRTLERRPELLKKGTLSWEDQRFLESLQRERA